MLTEVQNFSELIEYIKELHAQYEYTKDCRCCDYDTILANQTNIKYPCLWVEDTPNVRESEEGDTLEYTFTLSMLIQETSLEKDRLAQSLLSLQKLINFVKRMKAEANGLGYEIIAQEYEKDFSLSVDKDTRWRVEITVTFHNCEQLEASDWKDL